MAVSVAAVSSSGECVAGRQPGGGAGTGQRQGDILKRGPRPCKSRI